MADEKTEFENHIIPYTRRIYASHPNEVICGENKNSEVCEMKLFEQRFQNEFTWAENILGPHSYVRRFIQIVLECISNVQTFARGTNKHLRFSVRVIVAFRHKKLSAWTRFIHERPQCFFPVLELFAKLRDSLVSYVQKAVLERCQQLRRLFQSVLSEQFTNLVETPFEGGFDRFFSFPLIPFTELRFTPSSVDIRFELCGALRIEPLTIHLADLFEDPCGAPKVVLFHERIRFLKERVTVLTFLPL